MGILRGFGSAIGFSFIWICGILRRFDSVIGFLLQRRIRTRAGSCYAPLAVGGVRENRKQKRHMMNRDKMNGERFRRETAGVNHFDDLPDDVLISVLAKFSTSAKYAAEYVNVLLTCKGFNTLGLHLLVLPQEKVYQKLQNMKEMYYLEIEELYQKLLKKCQQPMAPDRYEKLKFYTNIFQRIIAYFHVQKNSIPRRFKEDQVDAFEKNIQAILNAVKQKRSAGQQRGREELPNQTDTQVQSMQQQSQTQLYQM